MRNLISRLEILNRKKGWLGYKFQKINKEIKTKLLALSKIEQELKEINIKIKSEKEKTK
jgi:hypothetical protein